MVKVVGYDTAINCPKMPNLVANSYHGEKFEGNTCCKLLKNSDVLTLRDALGDISPLTVQAFARVFKAMNKYVDI